MNWFGCEDCDAVIEQKCDSVSGAVRGIHMYFPGYKKYLEALEQKNKKEAATVETPTMHEEDRMKIKIIAIPPGQAPEWVRQAWIGLKLSAVPSTATGRQIGVRGGRPENLGGYEVYGNEAIELLKKKNPEAAQWWKDNLPGITSVKLVFKKEVCEETN
jgi:hypothetical protein